MLTEFRKSVNSILYERLTSPLFGTFFLTWILWNWKIVYLTIFISEKQIDQNKIDFIVTNYCDGTNLLWYPLISTIVLVTVYPFVSTAAFWIAIKFNKWKLDIKNKEESIQLLSLEQSIQ